MDGVVIDSEKLFDESDTKFLQKHGVSVDIHKLALTLAGTNMRDGTKYIKNEFGLKGTVGELYKDRLTTLLSTYHNSLAFMPGFKNFHKKLITKGIKTCIATASPPELVAKVDEILAISKVFYGHVYKIKDAGNKSKPDPAIFLYSANKLNSKPADCIVIEDSPKGIAAAKNAGMKCVGITTTFKAEYLKQADVIVDKFSEIIL